MIRRTDRPDLLEARQLYAEAVASGALKPRLGLAIARQLADAVAMGFVLDGRLIALMTLTVTDLMFDGLPALEVSVAGRREACRPHLIALTRLARLTLADWQHDGSMVLCAVVRTGHRPGEQLARLGGFGRIRAERGLQLWTRYPDGCGEEADFR